MSENLQKATFGAGCFWGVEEIFKKLPGVSSTAVGYMGGHTKNPTYKEVCSNQTGHAEVLQLEYDPVKISYEELLQTFWDCHNPTQVNRQGPDYGTQYRSAVFFHSLEQEELAKKSKAVLENSDKYHEPIATEIVPAETFYRAEEYHQQYFMKNGGGACHI